jgi:hypothetical protein
MRDWKETRPFRYAYLTVDLQRPLRNKSVKIGVNPRFILLLFLEAALV